MPVLSIRSLPGAADRTAAATRIGAAVAASIGKGPGDIWVVWTDITAGAYGIAGEAPSTQPEATHAPLVEISGPTGYVAPESVPTLLRTTASAVAAALGIVETNVEVVLREVAPRRLYSRGRYQ